MAIIKPKLDFSNTKVTLWRNIIAMVLSSDKDEMARIYPSYYINKIGGLGKNSRNKIVTNTNYFHEDYDTITAIEDFINSTYDCEASGRVLGGNSTIETIEADADDQCLMPKSGSTIESFQFYLSIIGQEEDDISGPFPDLARKDYAISEITGLDYSRWISSRDGFDTELSPSKISPSIISGIIERDYERYASIDLINDNNFNDVKFQNATGYYNFRADQIQNQFPLPNDFLGGKILKTKAETMNAYLKLYQKSYQLCNSVGYFNQHVAHSSAFSVSFYMCKYKENHTEYDLTESGNDIDGWEIISEESKLNGETESDDTLWDTTEFVNDESAGATSSYIEKYIIYRYTRNDYSDDTWSGSRGANNAYKSRILKTLYLRPYNSYYNSKQIINLVDVKNSDIELYCEVQIMIVYWFTSFRDHKFQTVLNEDEDGSEQEQQRDETIVEYESPIDTPREATYTGIEEEIGGVLLYDQKHMLNVSNLLKNHLVLYKEPPPGTVDEKFSELGVFNGESNPYGLIKIDDIDTIIEGLYTSDTPSDIPSDSYTKPKTVVWESGSDPNINTHENGEDNYTFYTNQSIPELRTVTKWYQKINGEMIPIIRDTVYDSHDFSFDFSD